MKVVVGLSGGVDSALAAALLKEQGYEVTGVFLECFNESGCRTDQDRKDALGVALKLKIKFKVLDFKREYKKRVLDWFYREYKAGRTPNPDVVCNREIKFGLMLNWAMKNKFDYLATGHFARIVSTRHTKFSVPIHLFRSVDKKKDQTYFLAMLKEKQLKKVMFPIGNLTKKQIRQEAKKRGLKVWDKKDSTGICLVGHDYSFEEFLKRKIKEHEGKVVNIKGGVIGKHQGVEFYTIGQRHGFKITEKSTNRPRYFVVGKEMKKNIVIVGGKKDLARKEFEVEKWSWISSLRGESLQVRIRHQGRLIACKIKGNKVILSKAEYGIAPGQVAVIYQGSECLGGGIIK